MMNYMVNFLPTVHKPTGVSHIVDWVARLGVPQVPFVNSGTGKETCFKPYLGM